MLVRIPGSCSWEMTRVAEPLSIRDELFEAAIPVAQLARLTTHQPPPYGDDCKSDYQPAGYALTGRGSHPLDDSSKFQSTSINLPLDRHRLVASSNRLSDSHRTHNVMRYSTI
jgi:hypothetical protein